MEKRSIVILVLTLLISVTTLPIANSLNHTVDGKESSMIYIEKGIYHDTLQDYELKVGVCDLFDTDPPAETTGPSPLLLDWIDTNYAGISGSKDCDEDTENQYWAHTFSFQIPYVCPGEIIESATLQITIRNDDDNDHLKIGCISCGDGWKYNNRLEGSIPVGSGGTIILDLEDIPGLLDLMNEWRLLDIAVDDDSPVDCAILTLRCGCSPNVIIEKTVSNSQNGPWLETWNFDIDQTIWFKIKITNWGSEANILFVEDILPEDFVFDTATPPEDDFDPILNTVRWEGFTLVTYQHVEFILSGTISNWNYDGYENFAWVKYTACGIPKLSDEDTINITRGWFTPDLDAHGTLHWSDIKPGSNVVGSIEISNIGENGSYLNWEIADYPSWGTWSISPSNGTNLKPEDGPVEVEVEVEAPDEKEKEFKGELKVVNIDNTDDYEIIQVSLSTPKSKTFSDFHPMILRLIQRFSILEQLL